MEIILLIGYSLLVFSLFLFAIVLIGETVANKFPSSNYTRFWRNNVIGRLNDNDVNF